MMDAAENAYKVVEKHTDSAVNFVKITYGYDFAKSPAGADLVASMVKAASENYMISVIVSCLDKFTKSVEGINDTLRRRM